MTRVAALFFSLSVALTAPYASADSYDAAMARAAAAKEKALDANDAASWEDALARFREADAIRETKESKYEVATAAAWLKQDDLAVEAYSAALSLGIVDPAKSKAEAYVAERATKMAKLKVTGPAGARVSIDGRPRGTLPRATPLVVFAGSVKVRVESGSDIREGSIEARAGEETTFDGTPVVTPPPPPKPIETPPPVKEAPPPAKSNTLGWSLLIGGGVVVVGGVTAILIASPRVSDLDDKLRGQCRGDYVDGYCDNWPAGVDGLEATRDTQQSLYNWRLVRTTGIITSIVGGAAAITGGVLLFSNSGSETKTTGVRANFAALPGGGFLTFSGAF